MRLWSIPHCTRADCLLLRSLKGQEPAPSGCWELPLELHRADRGHSLHPDRVRDPAPLRVAQPHGPAQSHGKWDPSRAPDRRWGRENKGFCSGDVAVAGKPHCCLFSHGPGWVSPRVCIPALPTLGARPQVRQDAQCAWVQPSGALILLPRHGSPSPTGCLIGPKPLSSPCHAQPGILRPCWPCQHPPSSLGAKAQPVPCRGGSHPFPSPYPCCKGTRCVSGCRTAVLALQLRAASACLKGTRCRPPRLPIRQGTRFTSHLFS